jgi:hypothetical protein
MPSHTKAPTKRIGCTQSGVKVVYQDFVVGLYFAGLGDGQKLTSHLIGVMTDHPVMAGEGRPSTTCLRTAKEVVDGRPSPAMTGWAKTVSHLTH